ncbi:hypothetical protein D3C87_1606670 [compost metagenome]
MLFQVRPQFWRQIGHFMGDLEVVRHAARFFYRTINKGLFFSSEARLRVVVQFFPVRVALEQIAFPPGSARVDCFFFRA